MTFLQSFSLRMVSQGLFFVIAFANNVLITRALGPEGRGYYALLATTVAVLVMLLGEGIRQSNAYLVGKNSDRAPQLFSNTLFYGGAVASVLLFLYWAGRRSLPIPYLGDGEALILFTLLIAIASILFQGLGSILLGLERMIEYNVIPVVFIFFYFCANILALKILKLGLTGVMYSWLLTSVLTFVLAAVFLKNISRLGRAFDAGLFYSSLRIGLKATVISVILVLLYRSDVYLVNYFLGAKLTGIYSIAILFAEMLQKVPDVAGTVLFSKIASATQQEGDQLTAKVSRGIFWMTLLAALGLVFLGRQLIPFLFGRSFVDSYLPLIFMLPGVLAVATGSVVNTNLWRRGYPTMSVIAPAVALCVNIVLNLLLIPAMGLIGAGLATAVAYSMWGVLILGYFSRNSAFSFRDLILLRAEDFAFIRGSNNVLNYLVHRWRR
ncbi:MAG TPA: hypothetical protein EYP53_06735 [Candidatus Latescibacteria bacterium]|nr:hypothetical protein [Candidatus Latescibacterota bacterium]